jgi:RNA polymerase sigma factor (sigma-70 family)
MLKGVAVPASGAAGDWAGLVERIRNGDSHGVESLYAWLNRGVRVSLRWTLGPQSSEDRLHEILIIVLEAIRRGQLRDPASLEGFVRTVARRAAIAEIRRSINSRRRYVALGVCLAAAPAEWSPEARAALLERADVTLKLLDRLKSRDREILTRFYLNEQSPAEICGVMQLSPTQFRLFKSRAIAKCHAEVGRRARTARPS